MLQVANVKNMKKNKTREKRKAMQPPREQSLRPAAAKHNHRSHSSAISPAEMASFHCKCVMGQQAAAAAAEKRWISDDFW
jgi:hypothetical protein